jgi:hypothetical protein
MNLDHFIDLWSKAAVWRQILLLAFILLAVLQWRLIMKAGAQRKLKSKERRDPLLRRFLRWLNGDLLPQVSTDTLMCCAFLDQLSVLGKNGKVSDTAHRHAHRLMCKVEELANEVQK